MEEGSAKSEENARYSFLLGSALRNEDTEQFLRVYDAVVPKDLPPEQVGVIKEQARTIAVLSKEEFNALVTQFCSTDPVSIPVSCPGMSAAPTTLLDPTHGTIDEKATVVRAKCTVKILSGNTEKRAVCSLQEGAAAEQQEQGDSGVFNSSRNNTGNMSDDAEMADDNESSVIDYFPRRSPSSSLSCIVDNIELSKKDDNAYKDGDSSELQEVVVDKTMDQTLLGAIEMTTFRMEATACALDADVDTDRMVGNLYRTQQNQQLARLNTLQYDEAVQVDDDDDDENNHMAIPLQQRLGRKLGQRFSSMHFEDSENYDAELPEVPRLRLSSSRRVCPKASDGVRIEQEVRQRGHGGVKMPPFGDPVNVDKVSRSAERLIDFNTPSNQDVKNMPLGERIRNNVGDRDKDSEGNNTETASKKKKKKKKSIKDDGEESNRNQKDSSMDINGNPTTERISCYTGASNCSSTKISNLSNIYARNMDHSLMNGQFSTEADDPPSSKVERDQQKKTRATRRRQQEAAQMRMAEEIEGFRGHTQIDELLDFIESPRTGSKKQKKKMAPSTTCMVNGNGGDAGNSGLPNGHTGSESMLGLSTKNERKLKQNNKGKQVVSVLKDCEKSCSEVSSSEKADDSSSGGKSEGDEGKDTEAVPSESITTSTKVAAPETEQPKVVGAAPKVIEVEASVVGDVEERAKSFTASSNLQSFPSSIKDLVDDQDVFIFTDFENVQPLSEGEFNVVTRKKRPKVQAEPSMLRSGHQVRENYHHDCVHSGYRCNPHLAPREDRGNFRDDGRPGGPLPQRSRLMVRSVTPPPITSTSVEKEHYYYQDKPTSDRAFSPSAFPVLGGMREGRRNSTGDVPSAIDPDDSDMESVKSLPLGAGSATGGRVEGTMSPIISYAKIAAGPKSSCNKSGAAVAAWANKAEPEPESDTGRRHSLSSLMDPPLEHACSEALCPTQTACSDAQDDDFVAPCEAKSYASPTPQQEAPVVVVVSVSPKTDDQTLGSIVDTTVEASRTNDQSVEHRTSNQLNVSESDISDNKVVDVAISTVKKTKTGEPLADSLQPQLVSEPMQCASGLIFGSSCNSNSVRLLDQTEFPAIRNVIMQELTPSVVSAPYQPASKAPSSVSVHAPISCSSQSVVNPASVNPASVNPTATVLHRKQQQPKAVTVSVSSMNSTTTTTTKKKQKNKSVVFLDRRSRHSTPNLGISFGFDTNFEVLSSVASATSTEATITSTMPSISAPSLTALPLPTSTAISDVKQAICAFNGIVMPTKPAVTVVTTAGHSTTAVISTSTIDAPKVMSSTQAPVVPVPKGSPTAVIQTNVEQSSDNVGPIGCPLLATENNKRVFNVKNLVPLARNMDPNFVRGCFHVEEIAYFLKEQWDHVMDKKNKHPGLVTHYSCQ